MIESANTRIANRNMMVANLSKERRELTAQVWKFLIEKELNLDLSNYKWFLSRMYARRIGSREP